MSDTALGSHIHPPKVETFDVEKMINIDPKGVVREVDEFRVEEYGLYLARPVVDHSNYRYIQSWLLPELGIRVSSWSFHHHAVSKPFLYLDMIEVKKDQQIWRSIDYYLDIVVYPGEGIEIRDTDELLLAAKQDLITTPMAERALQNVYQSVERITHFDYSVPRWLASLGISLQWQEK